MFFLSFFLLLAVYSLLCAIFFSRALSILCHLVCSLPLSRLRSSCGTAICYITRIKYGLSKIVHVNTLLHSLTHSHTHTRALNSIALSAKYIASAIKCSVYCSCAHTTRERYCSHFSFFRRNFHRYRRYSVLLVVAFAASSANLCAVVYFVVYCALVRCAALYLNVASFLPLSIRSIQIDAQAHTLTYCCENPSIWRIRNRAHQKLFANVIFFIHFATKSNEFFKRIETENW